MPEPAPTPMPMSDILVLAASAVGKVDRSGVRGATLVSREETVAMALLLAMLGLPPVSPDTTDAVAPAKALALTTFFNSHFNGGSNDR